jgi:hypothetical protein
MFSFLFYEFTCNNISFFSHPVINTGNLYSIPGPEKAYTQTVFFNDDVIYILGIYSGRDAIHIHETRI